MRKWYQIQNYDQIFLKFHFEDEQPCVHICAKRICDLSSSFEMIPQKACSSYGEQDSSTFVNFYNYYIYMPWGYQWDIMYWCIVHISEMDSKMEKFSISDKSKPGTFNLL
jgi:hypothetical protein